MSFAARYGGTCSKCAGHIPAGANVNYDGKNIRHAPRCPAKGTVTEVAPTERKDEAVTDRTPILGRARYKGKSGYLILWHGTTREGKRATKLAFRDGSKVFWGNGDVLIEKMYDEPITFGRLNRLADEYREQKKEEKQAASAPVPAPLDDSALQAAVAALGSTLIGTETRSWTRDGKDAVQVGAYVRSTARDKSTRHHIVIAVDKSYYMSRQDCEDAEDMDDFGRKPGWYTSYTTREITEPSAARLAREKKEAEEAAAKLAAQQATAEREAKIATATAGLVKIAGTYGTRGAVIERWGERNDWTTYSEGVAKIDGSRCVIYDWDGYDDGRNYTFVTPATRDAIFSARLTEEAAKDGHEAIIARCREHQATYAGCYGSEYYAWVLEHAEVAA